MTQRWSDRLAWMVVLALMGLALATDLARITGGRFFGDGATYYAMAWSLADDSDLQFLPQDLARVKAEYPDGPQGVFLKRAAGGLILDGEAGFPWIRALRVEPDERRIYYAKPLTYPLVAWPFVKAVGTRGLLLVNALSLGLALVLGVRELRERLGDAAAWAVSLALILLSASPAYLIWPTPELFYLFLATAGLVAWSRGWPLLSALLLGLSIYSKLSNLWLALPLGIEPLRLWRHQGPRGVVLEMLRRGLVLALTVGGMFALNRAITGEWYYQGGAERKTFYGSFPFEGRTTFGNSGIWMSANQLGPRVEGASDSQIDRGAEPPRSPTEYRQSFVRSLGYFWWGRFAGALPYFPGVVLAALAFVGTRPRDPRGWLALTALVVSWLFYIDRIPDNWYGGSGSIGNRYFLNLVPLGLYLVPARRWRLVAIGASIVAAVFLTPIWSHPVRAAIVPGGWTTARAWRSLPLELSMLNDLAIFAQTGRKKIPFGDTEGDPHKGWPADPKAYYAYFPDDGTYGKERAFDRDGFWVRGGDRAEVIVRALEPVERMRITLVGGPVGDDLVIDAGATPARSRLGPGQSETVVLEVPAPFVYKDTFVYVLRLRSTSGGVTTQDPRSLGTFASVALDVRRCGKP